MLCLPRQVRAFSQALESRLRWSPPSSSYASGRCLTTASASNEHELATKDALRKLLRETAQPVAVVTSYYPFDGVGVDFEGGLDELGKVVNTTTATASTKKFHGATLSSFSSIALDPYPLIAFSLRIPSRMATSLKQLMLQHQHQQQQSSSSPSSSSSLSSFSTIPPPSLVVNLLSSTQSSTAHHFARADLFPDPFRITPHTLNADNLPVLTGSLGSLTCSLVSCIPLHTLSSSPSSPSPYPPSSPSPNSLNSSSYPSPLVDHSPNSTSTSTPTPTPAANTSLTPPTTPPPKDGLISELFISRVIRVEPPHIVKPPQDPHPLLYHHRKYTTVLPPI